MLTGSVVGVVSVCDVGLDRAGPVKVLRVTAAGVETVTAVPLLTVAEAEIVIVVPVLETMVVPVGMPGPAMTWPFTSPVRLDTAVRTGLPAVTMAVGVAVLVTVAFADSVTVEPPIAVMVVTGLVGIPAPVTA
jgi:hypothetical protein